MKRLEANLVLIDILTAYLKQYPDMRFGQALTNLGLATHRKVILEEFDDTNKGFEFFDIFYEEPTKTLERFTFTTTTDELSHTEGNLGGESGETN